MFSNWLLLFIPLSLALKFIFHAPNIWVFLTAALAIIPLAVWIQRSTEQISKRAGPSIGGLLNVTFGNAPELVLALFVLMAGSQEVVKGQITGSIIGNGLLGLGLAIVIGSWSRESQNFNRDRSGLLSTLLILSVIGILLPALFDYTERNVAHAANAANLDEQMSLWISIVLILLYLANLIYTLFTHRDSFKTDDNEQDKQAEQGAWPVWKGIGILLLVTVAIAVEAEILSGALESTAKQLGISPFFLGVTVLAVIGNAAEYATAIAFSRQDRMNLVMSVTVGSTIQVALLIAPLLVLISYLLGHPMNLVFGNPIELIAIAGVAFAVNAISKDGKTNWFEGVLLLGVYLMLAISFFFVTPSG